jgi:hypothetical protein
MSDYVPDPQGVRKPMEERYFVPTFLDPYPLSYRGGAVVDLDFHDALIVRREIAAVKLRNGKGNADFILQEAYRISYRIAGQARDQRYIVEVPRGMLTDLSSVPWFARLFISQVGLHLEASIVHDFLYVAWQDVPGRGARRRDRLFADKVLLAGMIDARVSRLQRFAIYWAVRLFGRRTYETRDRTRYYDFWSP